MPNCIILVGPPCSGKSTFTNEFEKREYVIYSCDNIRIQYFSKNGKYIFSKENEKKVWNIFYILLEKAAERGFNIIIDNTNCKREYINKIENIIFNFCKPDGYKIEYRYFDIPLWKLLLRNYIRYFRTRKWIPIKVIKNMKENFNKIKYQY